MRHERGQRLGPEQRHVTRQQDQRSAAAVENALGLQDGVAGPELRFLRTKCRSSCRDSEACTSSAWCRRRASPRPASRPRDANNAFDERQPADAVQELGAAGFHPRALPGSEDDDVEFGRAIIMKAADYLVSA